MSCPAAGFDGAGRNFRWQSSGGLGVVHLGSGITDIGIEMGVVELEDDGVARELTRWDHGGCGVWCWYLASTGLGGGGLGAEMGCLNVGGFLGYRFLGYCLDV